MTVELTTMVMIQNPQTLEVLVQNRKRKWPGWSFPGGKVEHGENFHACAVREIKEETGLDIKELKPCGLVHWCDVDTNDRYLVFLYKTRQYSGQLIEDSPEGDHFWCEIDVLLDTPQEKFSSDLISYCHLFLGKDYNEAFIPWKQDWRDSGKKLEIEFI
ncbi:MAG: 8-oxo-dGTP diphosphatase [Oscillospiraceae bacterium]|nr:8-oxo-dGTP diphosphatase [Oscillospiraceae bacterium]